MYVHVCHLYMHACISQKKVSCFPELELLTVGAGNQTLVPLNKHKHFYPTSHLFRSLVLHSFSSLFYNVPWDFLIQGLALSNHLFSALWPAMDPLTTLHLRKPDPHNMSQATVKTLQCMTMILGRAHISHQRKLWNLYIIQIWHFEIKLLYQETLSWEAHTYTTIFLSNSLFPITLMLKSILKSPIK